MFLVARLCLPNRILTLKYRQCLLGQVQSCYASTTNVDQFSFKMVPFKSISKDKLGHSILHKKEHGGPKSVTDTMNFGIKCAKLCSLGSSALGLVMIPVMSSYLSVDASERPSIMVFTVFANAALGILAMTPLLLHSLTRRFVLDVYYNAKTDVFTTVHYNFIMQKRALQFRAQDVVLPEQSAFARKMWIPLATCFVNKHPLLLLLEQDQYSDQLAFQKLTANLPPVLDEKPN